MLFEAIVVAALIWIALSVRTATETLREINDHLAEIPIRHPAGLQDEGLAVTAGRHLSVGAISDNTVKTLRRA